MSGFDWLVAALVTVTLIGVAIGRYPWLKMNRATIALVGATLLIALGALTLDEAYRAVDWNTILLLFGMMIWTFSWYRPSGDIGPKELAARISHLFVHGFKAPPANAFSSPSASSPASKARAARSS